MSYEPIGYYSDCDTCYHPECFNRTFDADVLSNDWGSWQGFEDWDEPLVVGYFGNESDTPTHCARCEGLIPHDLTSDGYDYVGEALTDALNGSGRQCIVRQWWEQYGADLEREHLEVFVNAIVSTWPITDDYSPKEIQA